MKTVYFTYAGSAAKTLKFIGTLILVFCIISTIVQLYFISQAKSTVIDVFNSFTPVIIGLFCLGVCFGLSSIIRHLLLIKEQQTLLMEEKGIVAEFEEMPEAGIPEEVESEESKND